MNVIDALNSRYCCRAFKPEHVSEQRVQKILEAAIRAPSWNNSQPWEIYIASGEPLERLRKAYLTNLEKGVPLNPDLAFPQSWPPAMQKRMGEPKVDEDMLTANYRFFNAPVVIYLCMDRTLTPWSVFDLGSLAQSIMLAAKGDGLDTAPALMLVSFPDLIRAELGIPDSHSIIIGIALGFGDSKKHANEFRSPRCPLSEVMHVKGF